MSQLGYMVLALGLGSYQAALFHLITHAYSKALLFLGSGSVIHGLEPVIGYNPNKSQNMTYMGGLRSYMPITSLTFLIGTLSLCGIPPFACFWSKDAILADAWHKFPVLGWVAWFTAGLTAFYMFRIYFITFEGQFRGSLTNVDRLEDQLQISKSVSLISFENKTRIKNKKKEKSVQPHESSQSMVLPLIILATAASFVGIIGAPLFYNESLISYWLLVNNPSLTHSNTDWYEFILTSFPSVSIGILGAFLAWIIYGPHVSRLKNGLSIDPTTQGWPNSILSTVYNWSLRRAYIDEIYEKTFVWITRFVAKNLALIDEWGIDGIVNLGGLFTLLGGETTRYLETGRTTAYIFFITFVFVLLLNVIRIQ
jgi:NAD(P)H-quinone oxidoreductase subunit 5